MVHKHMYVVFFMEKKNPKYKKQFGTWCKVFCDDSG